MAGALASLAAVLLGVPAEADGGRFALVVGTNRGLGEEEQLRYAEHDALRMKRALIDVGGFPEANVTELLGASAESLRAALQHLKSSMRDGPHERLVVYVSSHASEGSLHLGGTELPLQELVHFVTSAPVRVGLLVVDACQSGRVTRLKGLKPREGPVTQVEATSIEGRVLISSSGMDEYAQESDSLQGSYFTHYLVAGLRGAADVSRDGKVTLEEAYAWAWARTVEATFASRGGVQRPSFSVDLRGAGQLVMAELLKNTSRLELQVQTPGRWLVVAKATGEVFADVDKGEGALSLALPQGAYRVQLRTAQGVLDQTVVVPPEGEVIVSGADFARMSSERVARKGGEETHLGMSVSGGVASGLVVGLGLQPSVEARLRLTGHSWGPLNQLLVTASWSGARSQTDGFLQTELELRLGAGHRFSWGPWSLALDLTTGPVLVLQNELPDRSHRVSLALDVCLGLEGRVKLIGPLDLLLGGSGGVVAVKRVTGLPVVPRLSASLGVVFTF